jgi:hypothetical protein
MPDLVRKVFDDMFVSPDATEQLQHLADHVELRIFHSLSTRRNENEMRTEKEEMTHLEFFGCLVFFFLL